MGGEGEEAKGSFMPKPLKRRTQSHIRYVAKSDDIDAF